MFQAIPPKFQKNMTSEKEQKIERSIKESENITFRQVFCCFCESYLFDVGDDLYGHVAVKCHHCKGVVPLNPAYFNRSDVIAIMKRKSEYIVPLDENNTEENN